MGLADKFNNWRNQHRPLTPDETKLAEQQRQQDIARQKRQKAMAKIGLDGVTAAENTGGGITIWGLNAWDPLGDAVSYWGSEREFPDEKIAKLVEKRLPDPRYPLLFKLSTKQLILDEHGADPITTTEVTVDAALRQNRRNYNEPLSPDNADRMAMLAQNALALITPQVVGDQIAQLSNRLNEHERETASDGSQESKDIAYDFGVDKGVLAIKKTEIDSVGLVKLTGTSGYYLDGVGHVDISHEELVLAIEKIIGHPFYIQYPERYYDCTTAANNRRMRFAFFDGGVDPTKSSRVKYAGMSHAELDDNFLIKEDPSALDPDSVSSKLSMTAKVRAEVTRLFDEKSADKIRDILVKLEARKSLVEQMLLELGITNETERQPDEWQPAPWTTDSPANPE